MTRGRSKLLGKPASPGEDAVRSWQHRLCTLSCPRSPEAAHLILQAVRLQQVHLREAWRGQVQDLL